MPTTSKDVAESLGKPQIARLKNLGTGMKVGVVSGNRLLIKAVNPYTDLDRVEAEGKLYIPKSVKKDNTPLPSTGIVLKIGEEVSLADREIYKEGTAVLFSKFAGHDFVVDEEDLKIMEVNEILCTIEFTEPVAHVIED